MTSLWVQFQDDIKRVTCDYCCETEDLYRFSDHDNELWCRACLEKTEHEEDEGLTLEERNR